VEEAASPGGGGLSPFLSLSLSPSKCLPFPVQTVTNKIRNKSHAASYEKNQQQKQQQ